MKLVCKKKLGNLKLITEFGYFPPSNLSQDVIICGTNVICETMHMRALLCFKVADELEMFIFDLQFDLNCGTNNTDEAQVH